MHKKRLFEFWSSVYKVFRPYHKFSRKCEILVSVHPPAVWGTTFRIKIIRNENAIHSGKFFDNQNFDHNYIPLLIRNLRELESNRINHNGSKPLPTERRGAKVSPWKFCLCSDSQVSLPSSRCVPHSSVGRDSLL